MGKQDYAVGWLTLAFINANIAQVKGRSGLGFLIASLFLGPIITIYLSFINPIKKQSD